MPIRKLLFCTLLLLLHFTGFSQKPGYQKTPEGLILYPDPRQSGQVASIRLQVISDRIIRVTANPDRDPAEAPSSLSVISQPDNSIPRTIKEEGNKILLATNAITAEIDKTTGSIRFLDPQNNLILGEKSPTQPRLQPATFDGQPFYQIRQTFQTTPGEAFYGLGQHQDGTIDYRGRQVILWQNNSEVAVPFVISSHHYGILWDNYSLTTAGDTRPYMPLDRLQLFSAEGQQGWLTATYRNDKTRDNITLTRPESSIWMPWLGDSRRQLPAQFQPRNGSVTWTGTIASAQTGLHYFRLTYGGYCKVWIDGQLQTERWRQAWNPGAALLPFTMEKNKRYSIKIEWAPDGDESYISLCWQTPPAPEQDNEFGFLSEAGNNADYYFVYGANMDEVIGGYRRLTGKAPIPPRWAMGLWQSRERYKTQEELMSTVKEFRRRHIPLDNIVQDWSYWRQDDWGSQDFDPARFPSPKQMIDSLHRNFHSQFMISVWPKFYKDIPAYRQFDKAGWLYKRNVADGQRDWIAQGYVSTFYDAFNPAARKGFWDLIDNELYKKGIDAWWMDASEPDILSNVDPGKRKDQMTPTSQGPAAAYLNAYPLQNAKGIYEGQRETDPEKRVFILTRSAFAGSQRYGAAVWSGDIASRWEDLKNQIAAGINFSLSGIPWWTMDIGGFATEHRYEQAYSVNASNSALQTPKAEDSTLEEWRAQMTRWYQFGAFCPLFRVHGQYPFREIYNTAPETHPAYQSMLYYDKLRYRLLPYLYSLAGMTWYKDYTLMRGLAMDFAADTTALHIADEYLLGPSLLIAPVTQWHATSRKVYLPEASGWYDLYTGKYNAGGQTLDAEAPYERIPVFIKEGSILPAGPDLQYTAEKQQDPITLYVYTGANADFTLYEDENTNYNYEKGNSSKIRFHYDQTARTLTVDDREGAFPGMLTKRTFQIVWIDKNKPVSIDNPIRPNATLHYNGKKLLIKKPY